MSIFKKKAKINIVKGYEFVKFSLSTARLSSDMIHNEYNRMLSELKCEMKSNDKEITKIKNKKVLVSAHINSTPLDVHIYEGSHESYCDDHTYTYNMVFPDKVIQDAIDSYERTSKNFTKVLIGEITITSIYSAYIQIQQDIKDIEVLEKKQKQINKYYSEINNELYKFDKEFRTSDRAFG